MDLLRRLDVLDQPRRIACPTFLEGAGHFPWLDDPDRYFSTIAGFVAQAAANR